MVHAHPLFALVTPLRGRCASVWLLALSSLILSPLFTSAVARADIFKPEERVIGMLADGARVAAPAVSDWADQNSKPMLANLPVFDAARPFRWIIDQAVPLAREPEQCLEFFGGDTLIGRVMEYEPASAADFENDGEYLVIEPLVSVDLPGQPPSGIVRVNTDWLKRIVFHRRTGVPPGYHPGTAFLMDGSEVKFRGLRWSSGEVAILTERGVHKLLLSQLAELHLPRRDGWDVVFEQLAVLSPDLSARLIQVETSLGMRLTTSTERFRPQHVGDRSKPESWFPLFQPAWSLDPLTIPFATIRSWRFFAVDQLPLSFFDPEAVRNDPVFSGGWNWQRNQSVQRTSLKNQKLASGWGFGVQAPTVLSVPLHPVVQQVHLRTGLDQVAGTGGCARALLALSSNPQAPLWKSDLLIGSDAIADSGWINIPAQTDASVQLALIADPAINDRPANADPFDIRDCLNWIEPEWKLDRIRLLVEVAQRQTRLIPALKQWQLVHDLPPDGKPGSTPPTDPKQPDPVVKLVNTWIDQPVAEARYLLTFEPAKKFVVAATTLKAEANSRFLSLCVSRRQNESTPVLAQIRIGGKAVLQTSLPERTPGADPDPLVIPLSGLIPSGKSSEFTVEVVLLGEGDKPRIDWRGAVVSANPPGLKSLFEDDESFARLLTEGEGDVTVSTSDKQSGQAALRVTGGDVANARMPGLSLTVRENPKLGEFRFLRLAWKKKGGGSLGLQVGHNEELGFQMPEEGAVGPNAPNRRPPPANGREAVRNRRIVITADNRGERYGYAYDAAVGKQNVALRLDSKVPDNWVVHTRDLFGDFGTFRLTGFGFQCPDGEAAWFDHLYAARTQKDFEWIARLDSSAPSAPLPEGVLAEAREPAQYGSVVTRVAPQFTVELSGEPLVLLSEFNGRKNILRTLPPAQGKPCVFKAPLTVRVGKKTLLRMAVAQQMDGDWELVVRAADQDVSRLLVNADSAKAGNGWIEQEVDLSRFAGQNIVLEVHNHPNNWHYEHAFWHRLEVVEQ